MKTQSRDIENNVCIASKIINIFLTLLCTFIVPFLRIEPVQQVILGEVPEAMHIFDLLHGGKNVPGIFIGRLSYLISPESFDVVEVILAEEGCHPKGNYGSRITFGHEWDFHLLSGRGETCST